MTCDICMMCTPQNIVLDKIISKQLSQTTLEVRVLVMLTRLGREL